MSPLSLEKLQHERRHTLWIFLAEKKVTEVQEQQHSIGGRFHYIKSRARLQELRSWMVPLSSHRQDRSYPSRQRPMTRRFHLLSQLQSGSTKVKNQKFFPTLFLTLFNLLKLKLYDFGILLFLLSQERNNEMILFAFDQRGRKNKGIKVRFFRQVCFRKSLTP